ncbi:MAG: glycosyltransferase family 4 protein [Deltaproteobacteria bacterium]|nr:glycosyltransferase family 4 protein [Deltaproteobacteria bacterium]
MDNRPEPAPGDAGDKPVLAMVLKGYPRISETFIANEILLLERLGFCVDLYSMRAPREDFHHPVVDEIQARAFYLPSELWRGMPRFVWPAAAAAKTPLRFSRAARLAAAHVSRTGNSATVKHLLQGAMVASRLCPKTGIIHAHFAHSPASVARFASLFSGAPFSFFAHAKDIYTQKPARLAEKIRAAKFVVTCTEYNKRRLSVLAQGADTPIYRVYHGIDLSRFSARGNTEPRPPFRILTVARMAEKKGLPTVYHALARLKAAGVKFTHVLVGEGEMRPRIEALIRDLALGGNCRLLGALPHDKVLLEYEMADLFVLGCKITANGDRDGIPNVLVEALAMGVPACATNVSGLPELIRHEQTGLACPPEDPAALAGNMLRLLHDTGLRERVVQKGRALVEREFDNRKNIRRLAEIYARGLGGPCPPHGA